MHDVFNRMWEDFLARGAGFMTFRFVLQPLMATALAVRDGARDAKKGRAPYLFSIVTDPSQLRPLLREGWRSVARIFALAIVLDLIFQIIVFRTVHPMETLLIAALLALVPYLLVRGPANRIARRLRRRRTAAHSP